jgi:putative membrane protein
MFISSKSSSHPAGKLSLTLIATIISSWAITALPASAQGTTGSPPEPSTTSTPTTPSAAPSTSPAPSTPNNPTSAKGVAHADSKMMADLAETNLAEIETGRLALDKSQNSQVKKFAQQMIDDHTQALQDLRALAQTKGVRLPDSPDLTHKTLATAMRAMTANAFDSQYIQRLGVHAHQHTIETLEKILNSGQDADLKALATKQLPIVQYHLQMAQQLATTTDRK